MEVKLDDKAVAAIEQILKNGDKAVIQRKKDGLVVMAEKRIIKYAAPSRA